MNLVTVTLDISWDESPKYVIPTSNFRNAYIIGVPCKILASPYVGKWTNYVRTRMTKLIDIQSCVTGIKYTIPYEWVRSFKSLVDANDQAEIIGHHFPEVTDLIGKPYWPRDDSYISDLDGNSSGRLFHQRCEIVSVPFDDTIKDMVGKDITYKFILVRYEGKIYRTLFQEYALYEPESRW